MPFNADLIFKTLLQLLFVGLILFFYKENLIAQIPIDALVEDKNEMTDNYYGSFKFEGKAYTGNGIAYHKNGKIKTLKGFKNGQYHGMWTEWYPNGNRKFQGNRIKNKGHGLTKWWYENGQLKKQGTYDMDKQQGIVVRWYENGNLQQIRHYEQDKAIGPWATFRETGDVLDEGNDDNLFYRPFLNRSLIPDGLEAASPTFTADGKTLVYACYEDWNNKMPFIARYQDKQWKSEPLPIIDTLYNLAISPNGEQIIFKKNERVGGKETSKTYIVNKKGEGWSSPKALPNLSGIHAGYFHFTPDGTLFLFARQPRTGIYYAHPDKKEGFSKPIWLSDALALEKGDGFDVFVHPNKEKLILTQYYPKNKMEELGEVGFYCFEKINGKWIRVKRLPIAYGWGASITPDNKFVFVRNGNIQYLPLKDLNIDW